MTIYLVTNKINGKRYIGQTVSEVSVRWSQHVYSAFKNKSNSVLALAIRKYGRESFSVDILETCSDMEQLNLREQELIAKHETLSPNGYNLDSGGKNSTMHESTKIKLSAARIGKKIGPFTQEHRDNISKALKTAYVLPSNTPEVNSKKALRGNKNGMFGKKHSAESIAKMKLAKVGNKQ